MTEREEINSILDGMTNDMVIQALNMIRSMAAPKSDSLRYSVSFAAYNSRRHGRPWIARVTAWVVGKSPELVFGGFVGDEEGGEAEIKAVPGDIIRWGQKDGRGGRSENEWGIAQADGSILPCDQPAARAHWASR